MSFLAYFYRHLFFTAALLQFFCYLPLYAQHYKEHEYIIHVVFKNCQVQQFLVTGYWQNIHKLDSCVVDSDNVEKYFHVKTSEKNSIYIESQRGSQIEVALEADTLHMVMKVLTTTITLELYSIYLCTKTALRANISPWNGKFHQYMEEK